MVYRTDLTAAIVAHGGYVKVTERLQWPKPQIRKKKVGYWRALSNIKTELDELTFDLGRPVGQMPPKAMIVAAGRLDLTRGIDRYGGLTKVRTACGCRCVLRERLHCMHFGPLLLRCSGSVFDSTSRPPVRAVDRVCGAKLCTVMTGRGGRGGGGGGTRRQDRLSRTGARQYTTRAHALQVAKDLGYKDATQDSRKNRKEVAHQNELAKLRADEAADEAANAAIRDELDSGHPMLWLGDVGAADVNPSVEQLLGGLTSDAGNEDGSELLAAPLHGRTYDSAGFAGEWVPTQRLPRRGDPAGSRGFGEGGAPLLARKMRMDMRDLDGCASEAASAVDEDDAVGEGNGDNDRGRRWRLSQAEFQRLMADSDDSTDRL